MWNSSVLSESPNISAALLFYHKQQMLLESSREMYNLIDLSEGETMCRAVPHPTCGSSLSQEEQKGTSCNEEHGKLWHCS